MNRPSLNTVGSEVVDHLANLGRSFFFVLDMLRKVFLPPYRLRKVMHEIFDQGVASLPIIFATSMVTGLVLTLQLLHTLNQFGADGKTPQVLAIALVRELGPVLAALMFAGKAGGRMASEIGALSVGEQLKALRIMAIDPVRYVITNRLVAAALCLPLLTTIFDLIGTFAGGFMMSMQQELTLTHYINQMLAVIDLRDLLGGWLKSFVFGLTIAAVCTTKGFHAKGGSSGVGQATTEAIALSSILVIVFNLLLTQFNMAVID